MSKVIQEVDVFDVIKYVGRKNKKLQAILLQEMEKFFPKHSDEYQEIRKVVLDETSNFSRSILREIFGDLEILVK
jgi:hypothetical protein